MYQPPIQVQDYEAAVRSLRRRIKNPIVTGWPAPISEDTADHVFQNLTGRGISVVQQDANEAEYRTYMNAAAYERFHPAYYSGNLPEKSFEHFTALSLLSLTREDSFVDIAAEESALPEIAQRLTGATSYWQDIMYEPGIHGAKIGGDACAIPVPDGFATAASLTCSLEHFEGDADSRLFPELARVLRKGGKLCIVPLYLSSEAFIMTDPTHSATQQVQFDEGGTVYCCKEMKNRHGRFYSPDTLVSRIIAPHSNEFNFRIFRLTHTQCIDPSLYVRFAMLAKRI